MVEQIPPSVLPDISPTRTEIGWAHPLASTPVAWQRSNNESISPLVGGMSGKTEGGGHTRSRLRGHPHAH
jgi:hypothetical protein